MCLAKSHQKSLVREPISSAISSFSNIVSLRLYVTGFCKSYFYFSYEIYLYNHHSDPAPHFGNYNYTERIFVSFWKTAHGMI